MPYFLPQVLGPSIKRQALCAVLGMDSVATVRALMGVLNRYFLREVVEAAMVQATHIFEADWVEKEAAGTAAAARHRAITEAAVAAAIAAVGELQAAQEPDV